MFNKRNSNLIPRSPKASQVKLPATTETENSDLESSPPTRNQKRTLNPKGYYMGSVSTQNATEPTQYSGYDETTRNKTQAYSKKATQDSRLHTETADYDSRMRSTWSQNPYLDPESTHSKMMLRTSPNIRFDPNDSLIEGNTKTFLTTTQSYLDKFTKSVELVNSYDKRLVPISKNVFMSKTQRELIKKFNSKGTTFTEGGPIKTVKENRREVVELMSYKTIYCKIDAAYKHFPLNFKASVSSGSFEIYVSKSNPYPNKDANDYVFSDEDNFSILYENNLTTVYFSITALQYLRMSFVMNFKSEKEDKLRKEKKMQKEKNKLSIKAKVKMQLSPEELIILEATAADILQEKRQKMLELSKNKDIIKMNKTIAGDFRNFKEHQISSMSQNLNTHYERFQENRKHIESLKKIQQTYTLYKRPLMQLEVDFNPEN